MNAVTRWPALLLLFAAVVGLIVLDAGTDDPETATADGDRTERALVAAVGDPGSLSSSWYCSGGTVVEEGYADHTLLLGNPSDLVATVSLTIHPVLAPEPIQLDIEAAEDLTGSDTTIPPPQATVLDPVETRLEIPARSVERLRLADVAGVTGEHAAALIESDVGELVVEHQVAGPSGTAQAPCASGSSDRWFFAAGTSRKGARQVISLFNPFPGDAVVDLVFAADNLFRSPQVFDGLVVPSGSVLPVDISEVVTLFDVVSTEVQVRSGRIVADQLLRFDGSEGPEGLSVTPGAAAPSDLWVLPAGSTDGAAEALVVTNPSTDFDAKVDIELAVEAADGVVVEPIGLTIRPGRSEVVVLGGGADQITAERSLDASERVPDGLDYWVVVRSTNDLPVTVQRLVLAPADSPVMSSASSATDIAATRHYVLSGSGQGSISIAHPALDRLATVDITVLVDGEAFSIEPTEIAAGGRVTIDLAAAGVVADAVVVIDTSEPTFVERRLMLDGRSVAGPALPAASSAVELEVPLR